ncbi:actin like ALP2a [Babesia ovata]|uniref:Actin like ALP2a n=1 Tax=Babesia ovata TaxID=189622 RepID=A0A2H6KA03_9APIC|nr:actin like ALP2a [Babesia ovata]GBE59827.1 actin like ALP2a [Babesia ovata]
MAAYPCQQSYRSAVQSLVVDIGHGYIRGGSAGESQPRCIWPSAVGGGDDYDVFPLVENSNYRCSQVRMLRRVLVNLSGDPLIEIDNNAYLRAIRGTFGDSRVPDRRLMNAAIARPSQIGYSATAVTMGITTAPRDCWDPFNCRSLSASHRKIFTKLDEVRFDRIVTGLNRWNNVSSGMGEQENARPLFVVESNQSSVAVREQQMELVMEQMNSPGIYFGQGSALACYAFGVKSGLVIDVGAATTSLGLVAEQGIYAFREHFVGGDHVDALMYMLLKECDKNTLNAVLHHPSYSLGTTLREHMNDEHLPRALATRIWQYEFDPKHFYIQEKLRALKESVIHAASSPIFSSDSPEDSRYSDIATALMPNEENAETASSAGAVLPDGTPMEIDREKRKQSQEKAKQTQEKAKQTQEKAKQAKNWMWPPLQPISDPSHDNRESPRDSAKRLQNVAPDSVMALAAEILFDTPAIASRLPIDVGRFQGIYKSFEDMAIGEGLQSAEMFRNLVVVGGCANMPGFSQRLAHDFQHFSKEAQYPVQGADYRLLNPVVKHNRSVSSWIGASILSSLSTFDTCWISSDEYREHGKNICRRKGTFNFIQH